MDTIDQLKPYNSITTFYIAAINMCKRRGVKYNFTCPLCGGKAHVKKTMRDGSIRANCDGCKAKLKEA